MQKTLENGVPGGIIRPDLPKALEAIISSASRSHDVGATGGSGCGGSMADTRWLEKRAQGYYAVQDVPRALRSALGKKRFIVSLKTRDLRVAQARRHAALTEFARMVAAVQERRMPQPVADTALAWRRTFEQHEMASDSSFGGYGEVISTARGEVELTAKDTARFELGQAAARDYEEVRWKYGQAAADTFTDVAFGLATPLLHSVDSWLAEGGAKGPLRERTRRQYRADLERFATWLDGEGLPCTIEAVSTRVVGRYVTEALVGKGIDWATGNRWISAASAYWRWLKKRGYVSANPWVNQSLSRPIHAQALKSKRAFTEPEVITLLNGPADAELADLMRMAALTGARLEELYQLRAGDCIQEYIDIKRSKTPAGIRKVPIHPDIQEIITRRTTGKSASSHLFHEGGETTMEERSSAISKRFNRYRRSLGVDDRIEGRRHARIDFHSWRRWFATQARRTSDRAIVANILGHEVGNITDDVYSDGPDWAMQEACVRSVQLPAAVLDNVMRARSCNSGSGKAFHRRRKILSTATLRFS